MRRLSWREALNVCWAWLNETQPAEVKEQVLAAMRGDPPKRPVSTVDLTALRALGGAVVVDERR